MSKLLTSCLTVDKKYWIRYYDAVYEREGINNFWLIKISNEALNNFKSENFKALVLCRVAAVKSLPVYHHSAGYILFPLGSLSPSWLF